MNPLTRRKLLTSGIAASAGIAGLAAAGRIARNAGLIPPDCRGPYGAGETLTYATQRLLTSHSLAREFPRGMISKDPFANEIAKPSDLFKRHQASNFVDWRLQVDGLVLHPALFSLADLHALPIHNQITEVVCEEGWSYIAEWIGTPLSSVLNAVGVMPQARFAVYYAAETFLWGSIDMADALHPQTLLTLGMNDATLPVPFGGPIRLRVPRQLGYKSLKFITRITMTDDLKKFGKGLGSVDPEYGYSWYAGI
jgi:DMSO/TMAO reductase YedYZ molybdopterin-dependent catalytic subunit